ncbi:MAG TPA: flavodoxin domain-containing protein [Candidatus Deferrimicrobium sp.]|nr:flavodoxin domain-containing protein [Candidatus Deferrimicrobium sp.]
MRIQIVQASALGSTAEIADAIGRALERRGHRVVVEDAAAADDPGLFGACVIGSAVHGGHWLEPARAFVRSYAATLAERPVWLFSVGPLGVVDPSAITEPAEIDEFRRAIGPRGHQVFFGAHDRTSPAIERLPRVERFVARRFIPSGDFRDWPAIERWANRIADGLGPVPAIEPLAAAPR